MRKITLLTAALLSIGLAGSAPAAIESRNVLKSFFEIGRAHV